MASLGLGVVGAISGFSTAAAIILFISLMLIARYQVAEIREAFPVKPLLTFEIWVMLITFLTNLLINTDLFMVKSLLELEEIPKPDDAADALAVAICHIHHARFNSLIGA